MGTHTTMVKGYGAATGATTGRRYSVITPAGQDDAVGVRGFRGKCLCIVFYPKKEKFTLGVKAFAAAQEKFNKEDCVVIACTADSSWSTWSTSLGLTLKGEMAAITMNTCRLPDPDSLRKTTRERNFGKQKYDAFKRKSFYDLGLNTEQGQITLLGESELSAQCHLNFGKMLEATPAM